MVVYKHQLRRGRLTARNHRQQGSDQSGTRWSTSPSLALTQMEPKPRCTSPHSAGCARYGDPCSLLQPFLIQGDKLATVQLHTAPNSESVTAFGGGPS
jgi:hypothetical protein